MYEPGPARDEAIEAALRRDRAHPSVIAWNVGEEDEGIRAARALDPVSYTHLDVYKRQVHELAARVADPHVDVARGVEDVALDDPRVHRQSVEPRIHAPRPLRVRVAVDGDLRCV